MLPSFAKVLQGIQSWYLVSDNLHSYDTNADNMQADYSHRPAQDSRARPWLQIGFSYLTYVLRTNLLYQLLVQYFIDDTNRREILLSSLHFPHNELA